MRAVTLSIELPFSDACALDVLADAQGTGRGELLAAWIAEHIELELADYPELVKHYQKAARPRRKRPGRRYRFQPLQIEMDL